MEGSRAHLLLVYKVSSNSLPLPLPPSLPAQFWTFVNVHGQACHGGAGIVLTWTTAPSCRLSMQGGGCLWSSKLLWGK